ncbi:MAG: hypothetical protein KDE22_06540 [Rhodobacterales bacterium]|nr:hypothetical protein [Rhodobacterales bacterium]
MDICVSGGSPSGLVTAACLATDGHRVILVDGDAATLATVQDGRVPVENAPAGHGAAEEPGLERLLRGAVSWGRLLAVDDLAWAARRSTLTVVCPPVRRPAPDHDLLRAVMETLGAALRDGTDPHRVVLRWPTVPGTARAVAMPALAAAAGRPVDPLAGPLALNLIVQPDLTRPGRAIHDYHNPSLVLLGGASDADRDLLLGLRGPGACPVHMLDRDTAEAAAAVLGAWRAVVAGFAAEVGSITRSAGIDGTALLGLVAADGRPATAASEGIEALVCLGAATGTPSPLLDAVRGPWNADSVILPGRLS